LRDQFLTFGESDEGKIASALIDDSLLLRRRICASFAKYALRNLTSFSTALLSRVYNRHRCGDILDREQCPTGGIASQVADKKVRNPNAGTFVRSFNRVARDPLMA
jgi:hypothetical protein